MQKAGLCFFSWIVLCSCGGFAAGIYSWAISAVGIDLHQGWWWEGVAQSLVEEVNLDIDSGWRTSQKGRGGKARK
jgi:hypothetical protein